jgi:hypothetical protein
MDYNSPSNVNYTPPPDSAYVQYVDPIQDGINAGREAIEIREQIARQIGHVAVQGSSQSR